MSGYLTSALQGLGQVGTDLNTARTNIAAQKAQQQKDQLDQITANLRLQQIRQQMGMQTPEGIRGLLRGVLQREPTEQEVQQYMGIAPKAAPEPKQPTNDFELWRQQNPNAPVSDWLKLQESMKPQPKPTREPSPDIKAFGGFDWQYDPEKKLGGVRGGPGGQWAQVGATKAPASNIPKYSSVFTDEDPKSPNYGQRIGINSLTGKEEIIKAPEGVTAAKPQKPTASSTKTPLGAAAAMNNYMKAQQNLQLAQYIAQSGNLDMNSSVTMAKLARESAPKSDKFLMFFGGNPRSFTPDEAKKVVGQLQKAADDAREQVMQIYSKAGAQIPAQLLTKPEDIPGVTPIGK